MPNTPPPLKVVQIDLQPFCYRDPTRPDLQKPFSFGEWTYATDTHIAVRVPRIEDAPNNEKNGVKMVGYFTPVETMPLPPVDLSPALVTCEPCAGTGHEHPDCPECKCNCPDCHGSGQIIGLASVGIGEATFTARYISLLQALPGIRIAKGLTNAMQPVYFEFTGGSGVLMPRLPGGVEIHIEAGVTGST